MQHPLRLLQICVAKPRPAARLFLHLATLSQERIQCKSNLLRKHIVPDATCDICSDGAETAQHLVFSCSFAKRFWNAIGVNLSMTVDVTALWDMPTPAGVPTLQKLLHHPLLLATVETPPRRRLQVHGPVSSSTPGSM